MSKVRIHIDRNQRVSVQEIVLMLRQLREERAQVSLQAAAEQAPVALAAQEPEAAAVPEDWFGLNQLVEEELTRQISGEVTQLLNDPTLHPGPPAIRSGQPLPWISEVDEISSLLGEVNAPQPLLH